MDCPHCGTAFHDSWHETDISYHLDALQKLKLLSEGKKEQPSDVWRSKITTCPSCNNAIIELQKVRDVAGQNDPDIVEALRAYPKYTLRKPTPTEVPLEVKEDYEESWKVLADSEKASAALSRRCLQAILRGQGYTQKDLAQQIEALLAEPDPAKAIPTALRQTVDAIRNFGNFSAHPITDKTTLQVIAVEPGEAEWCLEILEDMFDYYYVKPAQNAIRRAALDAKLLAAGKPRSK